MNVFDRAKSKAPAQTAPSKKKDEKAKVTIVGLLSFSALSIVHKSLGAIKNTQEADVKKRLISWFVTEGMRLKARPDNIEVVEGIASASGELKCRASNQPFSDDEKALLEKHKIPFETADKVVETFVINPAYIADQAMLEKVSKALSKIKDLPEDFIQHQSHKVSIATPKSIDAVFALDNVETVMELLPVVTTLAVGKATLATKEPNKAFELVEKLLGIKAKKPEGAETAEAATA